MTSDDIIQDLFEKRFSICDDFIPREIAETLFREGNSLWEDGAFRHARIGTGNKEQTRSEIRSDKIHWLNPSSLTDAQQSYWDIIDELRIQVNRAFYFGLHEFEAHFAVYPEGSFYRRHLDQFDTTPYRFVSCLLYLNRDWKQEDGGQLRIYTSENDDYIDILPEFGRFACFLSADVPHEVLPSRRERYSLTGWLRKEKVLFGV